MALPAVTNTWGGTTNPAEHDPESFRYLIHIDTGTMLPGQDDEAYFVDDIDALFRVERLSTSLIDHRRKRGFSWATTHGFILEVPNDAIVATSSRDMWSKKRSISELRSLWPVKTPEEILSERPTWPVNNEVVIVPKDVAITGLLITGQCIASDRHDRRYLETKAEELSVPLLCIDQFET